MTGSDGVQEEACIPGVPCVTLRDNTERPETIEVGANVLAGGGGWRSPFGDGRAGESIIEHLHLHR
ncbi:MAG: UDP-N-acetylglucosamine 2-epimerase [Methanothrix sp.]